MNQTVKKIFDQHRPLCLASSSPRRKDMLQNFGLEFFSISPDIDESRRDSETAESFVKRVALDKARKIFQDHVSLPGKTLILSRDTIVVLDGHILGKPADHEGLDLINDDEEISDIPIHAIAEGTVIYARTGCPSSTQFSDNTILRECGAGWGNHLVVDHGDNIYSRYAHLRFDGIYKKVGQKVSKDEIIGLMGNSGRSDIRPVSYTHLRAHET